MANDATNRDTENGAPPELGESGAGERLILEDFVPYRLALLSNTISTAIAHRYADRFDLGIPDWRVMAVLGRFPDISANEVCERTVMDKVTVSRVVSRLLASGRILRRIDPSDRRRSILRLSAEGEAIYDEVVPIARRLEACLLAGFTAEERAQVDSVITKLKERADRLDALFDDPGSCRNAHNIEESGARESDAGQSNIGESNVRESGGGA